MSESVASLIEHRSLHTPESSVLAALAHLCPVRAPRVCFQQISLVQAPRGSSPCSEGSRWMPPFSILHSIFITFRWHPCGMGTRWQSRAGHSHSCSSSGGGIRDEIRFTSVPFLPGNLFVLLTRSPVPGCKRDAAGRRRSKLPPLGEG